MSPELRAVLTRIDALVRDGVCTPAEAQEQRRRAFSTEVHIPLFPLPPSRSLSCRISAWRHSSLGPLVALCYAPAAARALARALARVVVVALGMVGALVFVEVVALGGGQAPALALALVLALVLAVALTLAVGDVRALLYRHRGTHGMIPSGIPHPTPTTSTWDALRAQPQTSRTRFTIDLAPLLLHLSSSTPPTPTPSTPRALGPPIGPRL